MRILLRNSNAGWRRVFWRELLRRHSEFRREGNFAERKLSGFCSGGFRNTQSTSGNRFLLRRYSFHAEHHVGVMSGAFFYQFCLTGDHVPQNFELTLNKSANVPLRLLSVFYFPLSKIEYCRSKNCSAGNPTPFVNPGLKCTRTDAILKNLIEKRILK
jgi:hypothetical protein